MNSKKIIVLLVVFVFIFSSACFATNMAKQAVEQKTEELSDSVLEGVQLTVENAAGISLDDLQLTQEAFADLNTEEIQATVNAAIGMDEEEIRSLYLLPEDAIYITKLGDMVNFQVMRPMHDLVDFYQIELPNQGLSEREITTVINDTVASMVYTGHSSGKILVVQMVALNEGQTNVSIRLEEE